MAAPEDRVTLRIWNLAKSYGTRAVLRGVELSIEPGESVALVGGNGSGKTTILRTIAGLTIPDSGEVEICGVDAIRNGKEARRRLSYMPQKAAFPATLTVEETISFVARLRDIAAARVSEEIERCDLGPLARADVGTLSGGERQRLALACALVPAVDLYLFDEPSANLDARSIEIFRARASQLVESGRCVLFTTHVSADVENLATRVATLADGRIDRVRLRVVAGGKA